MTISSSTASRRYLDRSSFTSASAASFGRLRWRAFFVEPRLGFSLRDNREDLDLRFCNVIKHPDVANTESVLWLAETTESFDSALADFRRLVRQMHRKGIPDARTNCHRHILECRRRRWCQNDRECHSGHIVARLIEILKVTETR
jgi:hypothetical protein